MDELLSTHPKKGTFDLELLRAAIDAANACRAPLDAAS